MSALRTTLIAEFQQYAASYNRNPYNIPSAREEAGRCLQFPAPIQCLDNVAPVEGADRGYWAEVRQLVLAGMKDGA